MSIGSKYGFWETCENYLTLQNKHYTISAIGRSRVALYQSMEAQSIALRIVKVVSYALIFPPLIALATSFLCRKLVPFTAYQTPQNVLPPVESQMDSIATTDCLDTHEWRKRLISIAEYNIVISGNYCGGNAFDETLLCIETRMLEVPGLQVVIIAHPKFINRKNRATIRRLQSQCGNRLQLVRSPDAYFGIKKITNHTKCTVVDFGRYFIQGGSGIKDNFAHRGLLRNRLCQDKSHLADGELPRSESIKRQSQDAGDLAVSLSQGSLADSILQNGSDGPMVERLLPSAFRDQDFVFFSDEVTDVGKKVYQETLFLALKWEQFTRDKYLSADSWDLDKLNARDCLFARYPALARGFVEESDSELLSKEEDLALFQLLRTRIPQGEQCFKSMPEFLQHQKGYAAHNVRVRMFFSGPEDRKSDWEEELIRRINAAQHRVVIDQMYFQPCKRLMAAIAGAANRGVDLTIVTVIGGSESSKSERFFGPRNLWNLSTLASRTDANHKANLHLFAFSQGKMGLHKKVVVVDTCVLAGSGNMGTKSLTLTGDHEMNFEADSEELAEQTLLVIEADIERSQELQHISTTVRQKIFAIVHRLGARIWG